MIQRDKRIGIGSRSIGDGMPCYIIAEISANHNQNFEEAVRLIQTAAECGANAVKLQTYTADTLTIDCDGDIFRVKGHTIWDGMNLHDLYKEAYTPWEWQPRLKAIADDLGIDCFSTPFDDSSVDFLEHMQVSAYKIASFELVDLPLIRRVAQAGKPIIMSTGMATLAEIDEAVRTAREAGAKEIALLKCTSSYPAVNEEANLRTIPHMSAAFGVPVGLSDHTMDVAVPVAAVVLGACIIEKHLTLSRAQPGPDSAFSLEPHEFAAMVNAVRAAETALGAVNYEPTLHEQSSLNFRRSLFVVQDMKAGDTFTNSNLRSIRPGYGLHTRHFEQLLGRTVKTDAIKGTPVNWDMVD